MSLRARLLNTWLRLTEKPFLASAASPAVLRASFEIKAVLFFRAPFGVARTWRDLAGRPALRLGRVPFGTVPIVLYFHGGGFIFGSPRTIGKMVAHLVKKVGGHAVVPQYPLAPEHPFPAGHDHALSAYLALLDEGVDPARIILGGDSAGGNLALSLLARIIGTGVPAPAGVFALSPVTDLTYASESIAENARTEVVLPAGRMADMTQALVGGHSRDDPRLSPLFADFQGAPPVWLAVGSTEILRDDSLRMAERLRAQGVDVALTVAHDLPHVWPMFHGLIPEAHVTLEALAAWINQTVARAPTR